MIASNSSRIYSRVVSLFGLVALNLVPSISSAQTGVISTVAGRYLVRGYSGDGGPATQATLNEPYGVTVDAAGNIYIADTVNQVVRKVTRATGVISTVAGTGAKGYGGDGGPARSAQLNDPLGVAVDGSGNLYISDQLNNRIRKVDTAGIITTVAGTGVPGSVGDGGSATAAQLCHPYGLSFDRSGNLYVADAGNHKIRRISGGRISTVAGVGVTQCGQGGGFSGDGGAATSAKLNDPSGVTVDGLGNLYIGDQLNNRIRKVNTSGIISTVAGTGAAGYNGDGIAATQAQLHSPYMAAVDGAGNLYIPDYFNYRIRKVTASTGLISTVAGIGVSGGDGDGGPATQAYISDPVNVALDTSGNLYLIDQATSRIRMVAGIASSSNPPPPPPPPPTKAVARTDMDGDGLGDLTVWRPGTGMWFTLTSSSAYSYSASQMHQWGSQAAGDVPMMGDLDGDHVADLVVWRGSTGVWYWLTSSSGYSTASQRQKQWGNKSLGDVPMLADMDGDGKMDLVLWRASTGTWYWLNSSSGYSTTVAGSRAFGSASNGDQPKIGDVDGDGKADLIVWRPGSGTWYWLKSSTGYASGGSRQWGSQASGDVPLVADLDGDGAVELIVWRPSNGTWYWLTASSGYAYSASVQWGSKASGDIPLLTDMDGDGRADLIVWRASTGTWFWLKSTAGYAYAASAMKQWGSQSQGDIPIVK